MPGLEKDKSVGSRDAKVGKWRVQLGPCARAIWCFGFKHRQYWDKIVDSGSFSLSFHFNFHSVLQQSGIKNLKGFNIQNVHHLQFYAFAISTLFLYLLKILPVSYKELESYQKY